ncbi:hypothetical protein KAFR_0J00160 [Kazachstania africana CBS 2517]|uniref:Decapping nuclease n=1 Tax=Kazachstania africana (strain ATCC 22294 / BCRC 22015 / CBS 2517 / CECT 1963 / NBRC 1671 / NRRL Y-8276) TaxID=1071382 RepID=H2B0D4_KAZAF|nr:hypothetical protein KAFR_0J00160 [Kazachstania africana CBS 2517]CCF60084.1 hypothetical protein KAFR_0J00160 [Kazachstania africana CBS 2517]
MTIIHRLPITTRSEPTKAAAKPREVSFYSRTSERYGEILTDNDCNLRYYYFPDAELEKPYNLAQGRNNFINARSQIKDVCSLEGVLKCVIDVEKKHDSKLNVNVITFRGILRKLIMVAYEHNPKFNKINFRVVFFDKQVFIKEINEKEDISNAIDVNSYTGYKFEALTLLNEPIAFTERDSLDSRADACVSNGDEYVSVVKTGIGKHRVLMGGEVDGIYDFKEDGADNLKHYLELKCTRSLSSYQDIENFEKKLFKTWLQCFLIGIPRITYGFRDRSYNLTSIEEYLTEDVPKLFTNRGVKAQCMDAIQWYGEIIGWLYDTLAHLETDANEIRPFKLLFSGSELDLVEIPAKDPEYDDIVNGEAVLTNEFKEWRRILKTK